MITVVVGAVQGLTAARAVPGFFYASFSSSEAAVLWAVGTQEALMEVDWPAELLEHPACEEMRVKGPEGSQPAFQTVYRGPRAKMGIYAGAHPGSIHQASGRTTYPGSIANRTARISSGAAAGEILAAREVVLAFEGAGRAGEPGGDPSAEDARGVRFLRIGEAKLKGVAEAVEIFAVGSELLAKRPVGRNKFAIRSGGFVLAGDVTSSGEGLSAPSVSKSLSGGRPPDAQMPRTFTARYGPEATVHDNGSLRSGRWPSVRVGDDGAEDASPAEAEE